MIPILHSKTYIGGTGTIIGRLSDAVSCTVTEERNGEYELTMEYPPDGERVNKIEAGTVIVAKPFYGGAEQAFRVYSVEKRLTGMTAVSAHHISYDLTKVYLKPFTATGAANTIAGVSSNLSVRSSDQVTWSFSTDLSNTSSTYEQDVPASVRARLGGESGSVLDVFGGEYEWDNYSVILHDSRGSNRGVVIQYGKNLTELKREEDGGKIYTHVLLYWWDEDSSTLVTSSILATTAAQAVMSDFPQSRTLIVDASTDFDTAPTRAQLDALAQTYVSGLPIDPTIGLEISFVDLKSTTEGGAEAPINLCDTVRIVDAGRNVDTTAKVTRTVWNVLLDRYDEITVGTRTANLADVIDGGTATSSGGSSGGSGTTDYTDLTSKPQIGGVELTGNKTAAQLGLATSTALASVASDLSTHTSDSTIHVTAAEKATWNAKQDALTFDSSPTSGSTNPVTSGGVYTALDGKQDTLTFDQAPTQSSTNPVESGGVYDALAAKQNILTFDSAPASGSTNPVFSEGIYNALAAKQNALTFDSSPTSGSSNPVTSGGIYDAIADSREIWTGTCSTAAATATKEVVLDDPDSFPGVGTECFILVTFENGNTAGSTAPVYLSILNASLPMYGYTSESGGTYMIGGNRIAAGEPVLLWCDGSKWIHGATGGLQGYLSTYKANLASPTFTGTPKAPTATSGTNTTQIATTAFVQQELSGVSGGLSTATVTLAAASWSSNSQTVTVTGVTASGVVIVSYDPSSRADYLAAGVYCSAQAADSLTFACDTTPTADIVVNVAYC